MSHSALCIKSTLGPAPKNFFNHWKEAPFNAHFQPSFRRHNIRFAHISDQFELTNQYYGPQ